MLDQNPPRQWCELYRQALLESDTTKLQARIEQAEKAIQERARELWYSESPQTREQHDLDAALRFLGLLRSVVMNGDTKKSRVGMAA